MTGRKLAAVVGAAETTRLGTIPDMSMLGLQADAALNALADAGLTLADIDGLACAEPPWTLAAFLGLAPKWVDSTYTGGCSFLVHLRHAAAAIAAGYCTNVLIVHGESGRSRVGMLPYASAPTTMENQFERPYWAWLPAQKFTMPVARYMKDCGVTEEDLANVAVIQREWAAMNPRATLRELTSVDEVLASPMIAWPFRKLMCCLVTDGGGALVVTSAERAKDFPNRSVYVIGTGESVEGPLVSMMEDFRSSRAFRMSGASAFAEAGIAHSEVDHLMVYDAFAHVPLYGLEDLGFCEKGEAKHFYRERLTAPGGKLPMNTNGGGLCYMHSGMYGMYALQESVRQMRGIAPAQVPDAKVSVCHGVGGMFASAGTIVFTNEE
jgi:acetyl-CoA acetyltransferase